MNTKSSLLSIAASCVIFIQGAYCAPVQKTEIDKAVKSQIKRIALIPIGEPQNVQVIYIGGAAGLFGVLGGLAQGSENAEQSKKFVSLIKDIKPTLSETLTIALTQALKEDGYEVSIADGQKPKYLADKKILDFSEVKVDADVILCVGYGAVAYMCSSAKFSARYQPWLIIKVQIVDAKTKNDVYSKFFNYGRETRIRDAVKLPADKKYNYKSADDIMAHSTEAFGGIVDGEKAVAKEVGGDLKQ